MSAAKAKATKRGQSKAQAQKQYFQELGFSKGKSSGQSKLVKLDTSFPKLQKAFLDNKLEVSHNKQKASESVFSDDFENRLFRGGSLEELHQAFRGQRDLTLMLAEKRKLEATLGASLKTSFAMKNIRRRALSELDGDWDYDRRWDIAPFSATIKTQAPVKSIKINAYFLSSHLTSAKQLDQYGAFLAALVEHIEALGVTVHLFWCFGLAGIAQGHNFDARIEIKKPGEYLSPQKLATVFWTNNLRRLGFWAIIAAADFVGESVSSGLGKVRLPQEAIKASAGVIDISPQKNTLPQSSDVIGAIKTALGQQ